EWVRSREDAARNDGHARQAIRRGRWAWCVSNSHADRPGSLLSLCGCGWRDPDGISMADAGDVRRLALALPHVEEIESDGFDFRVADKGFVSSYPERRPGKPRLIRADIAVLFVGNEAEKRALLLGESEAFTTPGYDGARWSSC